MDYWVHLQILLFCLIVGVGISLFLGARSYIKIAIVVLLIYIPIEIYYSYKLSQALVPVVATLPTINISPSIIKQLVINAAQEFATSQTITADGKLITLPSPNSTKAASSPGIANVHINTVMANLSRMANQISIMPSNTTLPMLPTPSMTMSNLPDYTPRKSEESNRFSTEKFQEDSKYSNFNSATKTNESEYSPDKPPFDGLPPGELLNRLNYIYYATAQPAKIINYHDFKTHADVMLDTDGTKLSNDDPKLQSYGAGFYPQLTANQIDARDCLNYGSGPKSCFQSKQLFYNVAKDFNILDKGVNMENANLVVREDFSMPQNLEAIVSRPLPLDVPERNAASRVLFVNAPRGNLDRPLDQESNESLGKKLDDSNALCHNCKLAVCQDDYCGLQNALFM
jgi:hypothetical protein